MSSPPRKSRKTPRRNRPISTVIPDQSVQVLRAIDPSIDWRAAQQSVKFVNDGCVMIECWPEPERSNGGILLPDAVRGAYRNQSDIGTVIAVGHGVPLMPGDTILFNHAHGKRIEGYDAGGYSTENTIRVFGRTVFEEDGSVLHVPWWKSCIARIDGEDVIPLGAWALVERSDLNDTMEVEGTDIRLEIPKSATYRNTLGTVLEVGELAEDVEQGDQILYLATAVRSIDTLKPFVSEQYAKNRNLCFLIEDAILCKINQ